MKIQFEKILRPADASFACRTSRGHHFDCPYHWHPEIEVLLIEKSSGTAVIGDATETFRPGQLYLLGGDLPHMFLNDHDPRARGPQAQSRYIQFLPDCLGASFWALPENSGIARMLRQAARGIRWAGPAAQRGAKLLDEVFTRHGPRRIAALLSLLDFLAASRSGRLLAGGGYRPAPDKASSARLHRALHFVHVNLTGDINAVQAAKLAGFSLSGFHRFFSRYIGRSFTNYVIEQRLSMARRLLLEADFTVAEVCFRVGFGNLSNFNRHFRARCGCAPVAWRQRAIADSERAGRRIKPSNTGKEAPRSGDSAGQIP